jgi:hypothetical protein
MKRSIIVANVPPALREQLDARLIEGNFSNYKNLAAWITREGYPISPSSMHRYGQALEATIKAWRAPTLAQRIDANVGARVSRLKNAKARAATGVLVLLIDPPTRETVIYATHHDLAHARERIEVALSKKNKQQGKS